MEFKKIERGVRMGGGKQLGTYQVPDYNKLFNEREEVQKTIQQESKKVEIEEKKVEKKIVSKWQISNQKMAINPKLLPKNSQEISLGKREPIKQPLDIQKISLSSPKKKIKKIQK